LTLLEGPSGSGKTTLLSVLGGLLTPDKGQVQLDGRPLFGADADARAKERLRNVGFVFQASRLISAMNVLQNVMLPLQLAGRGAVAAQQRAMELLSQLGVDRHAQSRPHTLSGGERQRVAMARALANNPAVVLADEPTASLDSRNGAALAALLQQVAHEHGRVVVVVSHDTRLLPYADRVIRMLDGAIEDEAVRP
jgi:putative ABC transport system ATP-binding protein